MNAVKASVDKGIPVPAWGMGNVTARDGSRYDPMPEGCLIGGYDENDVLYVNLYPGPEQLPEGSVDEYGYTAIKNGLDTTNGLFFAGEKRGQPDPRQLYPGVINKIPSYLILPLSENPQGHRYVFGKAAFEVWADTLVCDSYFVNKTDDELGDICWNLHCSPYCAVCTSSAHDFLKTVTTRYPDLAPAAKLLPLYEKIRDYRQAIWSLQGGFFPPAENFRRHDFRAEIAGILRETGGVCDEILKVFGSK